MDQYYSNYTVKTLNCDFTHSDLPLNIFLKDIYIYIYKYLLYIYIYIYIFSKFKLSILSDGM